MKAMHFSSLLLTRSEQTLEALQTQNETAAKLALLLLCPTPLPPLLLYC